MLPRLMLILSLVIFSCRENATSAKIQTIPHPDILYISTANDQTLVLSDIDGRNRYPVTSGSDAPVGPFFTPDGQYIIYSAIPEGAASRSIYRYSIEKNETQPLTDDAGNDSDPFLSYSGSMLAFTSDRNSEGHGWNLFILDLETNQIKQLTRGTHLYNPRFSPDDSKILFSEYSDGQNHLSIIDTDGANYRKLESRRLFYSGFRFSSRGDKVYYAGTGGLVSRDLSGSGTSLVVADSGYTKSFGFYGPVDSLIFYSDRDYTKGTCRLYRLNIKSGQKELLTESEGILSFGDCSADGRKILIEHFINRHGNIVLLDTESGARNLLSNPENHDHSPRFNRLFF